MNYVIQCNKCKKHSAQIIKKIQRKVFTCPYCNYKAKLKRKNEYGLSLKIKGPYKTTEVNKIVSYLNNIFPRTKVRGI